MRELYIATNKTNDFTTLVMAKDKQDALTIVTKYAADADIDGKWDLKPIVPSIAKTMTFSCDYLIQDPVYDIDGVIDTKDIEKYYQNIIKLSQAIKICLNNDMTLLLLQESDGTIISKVVMGQGDDIEYTNVVSEQNIEEAELSDFLIGNSESHDALIPFTKQEAVYRLQKAKVKYDDDDINCLAESLFYASEEWIDGEKLHELSCDFIRDQNLEPLNITFTKASEIVDYIIDQYCLYGGESDLSSLYFSNIYISNMSQRDILRAYREILNRCNGDYIYELSDYTITKDRTKITGSIVDFAADSKYDELYSGNLETFLTSFATETAENTCFCRLLNYYDEENGVITGDLLDFVI